MRQIAYIAKLNQTNSLILDALQTLTDAHITFLEHEKVFKKEKDAENVTPDLVFFDLNTSTELKNAPSKIEFVNQYFSNPPLIVIHPYSTKRFVEPLLLAGANGIIPIAPSEEEIANAIEETMAGNTFISFS